MIRVSEHVRKIHSQDGGIVLDVKYGRMFSLNLVGSKIVELLDRHYTPAQIAEELTCEFGISVDVANRDLREFLDTLEKHHLIEAQPSGVAL